MLDLNVHLFVLVPVDHCSSWEEVLCMDWRFHPGFPVHLPADVDQQAGIRWVRPQHRPQEVLLKTVGPLPETHTAKNPNNWLCIHAYTNTLVYAEPPTALPIFPHHWLWHHTPWLGKNSAGSTERVPGGVNVWGTWCPLLCLCRSFQMCLFTTLFASMKVYSLVGLLPNRPVVLLNM